ncbi:MAG: acetyltransferase [Pirellulaceae bacterium]|nr:acetyltransferase [Pirellulaceae bacterium]
MKKTVILGAGGHSKVVIEVMRQQHNYELAACVSSQGPTEILGVPVVGDDRCLPELLNQGIDYAFVAIGNNRLRAQLVKQVKQMGFHLACVISPQAIVATSSTIAEGAVIMPGALIGTDAEVHSGSIVNSNATIDHDCILKPFCHIAPGSALAGGVTVGIETFLGTGVSVIPYISIGDHSVVGAGSVVIRNVPDRTTTFGVPAHHQQTVSNNDEP